MIDHSDDREDIPTDVFDAFPVERKSMVSCGHVDGTRPDASLAESGGLKKYKYSFDGGSYFAFIYNGIDDNFVGCEYENVLGELDPSVAPGFKLGHKLAVGVDNRNKDLYTGPYQLEAKPAPAGYMIGNFDDDLPTPMRPLMATTIPKHYFTTDTGATSGPRLRFRENCMMAQAKRNLSDKPTQPAANGGDQPKLTASKPRAPAEPAKATGKAKQPCGWADIQVGAIVLAKDPPEYLDWFECEVVAVEGPDLFTLRWRHWPNLPPVTRRRVQLALMHPACPPDLPPELI